MVTVKRGIQHQTENGDLYEGVYIQHQVNGLTFDTFVGYAASEIEFRQLEPDRRPVLVGSWVWDGDEELSASEKLL